MRYEQQGHVRSLGKCVGLGSRGKCVGSKDGHLCGSFSSQICRHLSSLNSRGELGLKLMTSRIHREVPIPVGVPF